ncbi:MAG: succinyl-CoA synthetase subunit alpha [Candidatus Diapherotrites archaeon]|uniref:Succinyl-CoA synthetase subunit alpha n=1 Tax=Candidatus Iainarchaeum sp. TaxID=3101447 RepID=A0A2D6LQ97_9ARCH|nr:succinyl-CoA synthetase subunit alpha [Candidatus Diapherotrites archaeon]|tara:strand:+ start:7572 stop:7781 length:210 start_codon:yes stop_codon:yes gene_type:complete
MTINDSFKTYEFYANADLSKYAGQWVAIVDNKVVAHGKNVKKILKEAEKEAPKAIPFIAKVPLRDILLW